MKLLLIWAAAAAMWLAGAEFSVPAAVAARARNATVAKYPDADNVLLYEKEHYTYQKDGLYRAVDEMFVKILTDSGLRELRTLSFHYNTHYSKVRVDALTVIKPDGRKIAVDVAKNSRSVIDSGQMAANIYDPANRKLIVSVPGLEEGDVLALKSTDTVFKARMPGCWSSYSLLQSTWPVEENIIEIDAPADAPLRANVLKDAVKGTVTHSVTRRNGRILYVWRAVNVPRIFREPAMPELHTCVQRLLVSTARDWPEISRWYWNLCRPRLDAVTPAMRAEVAKLTAGKTDAMAKVRAIFQFVSQKIRYMGITPEKEAPGYEPHEVKLTFEKRYGVCRDKAALLVAMLELAGFKAYPVLFMAGDPKDADVPNGYFNHAIAAVELKPGEYVLMDPTDESTVELLPSYLADMSYLVARPEGETLRRTPVVPAERNRTVIKTAAVLDAADRISGRSTVDFTGVNDLYYRGALSRWPGELTARFLSGRLRRALPGAKLLKYTVSPKEIRDMSRPLRFELEYEAPGNSGRNERLLVLPALSGCFGIDEVLFRETGLARRRFPLKLASSCRTEESYTLALPESVKVLSLPGREEFGVGKKLLWKRDAVLADRVIRGANSLTVNSLELTPPEYSQLRGALGRLAAARNAAPVARVDFAAVPESRQSQGFPGANSVVLNYDTQVKITDAGNWTERRHIRRRILNYAGVKAHSEVKIAYSPVWEEVKLAGSVTAPDGRKREISAKELNLMDAAWCGSAPRYPGEKILVASLPGVMPGAVVDLTIDRRMKNRPVFALEEPFFTHSAPILRRTLTVDFPDTLSLYASDIPAEIRMREESVAGRTVRRWTARNLPRVAVEPNQPQWWMFAPGVRLSSGSLRDYSALLNTALHAKVAAAPETVLKVLRDRKIDRLPDVESKLLAVRELVDKSIRKAGPGIGELPFSALSAPDVTLASGYGNSADRAILTGAMLKALGIEFNFVGAGGIGYTTESARRLNYAADPARCVGEILLYLPSRQYYLNDTDRYAKLGGTGNAGMIALDLRSGRLTQIQPFQQCDTERRLNFRIVGKSDDSAELQVIEELYGAAYAAVNSTLSNATPERFRRFFEARAALISPTAEVIGKPEFDFAGYPGVLRYKLRVPDFIARSGDFRVLALPRYGELAAAVGVSGNDRDTPFWRNRLTRMQLNYSIELPPGVEAVPGRGEKREIGRYSSAHYSENYNADSAQIRLNCRLELPVELVRPLDYCELEYMQRELSRPDAGKILFRNLKARPASRRR